MRSTAGSWGWRMRETDVFMSSKPIIMTTRPTIRPETYSARPCPKGCSSSAFRVETRKPVMETMSEKASERLLKASDTMERAPERRPTISFMTKRKKFKRMPTTPAMTPYAVRTSCDS